MFRLLFVILLAVAMLIGCDGVKRLDWKKTAEDQGLKLGQKIRVGRGCLRNGAIQSF